MNTASDLVAQRYRDFPYPPPLESWDVIEGGDPSVHSVLLWPEGRPRKDLQILVAGCGTMQAARFAAHNPNCRIVAIDVSERSLAFQRACKEQRDLKNLELRLLDLRDAAQLCETFDLIVCTGVLHHLERPEIGLRALSSLLTARGTLVLMLYAYGRRAGVYLLQDAFRRLGIGSTSEGISAAREIVAALPAHHYFNWYRKGAPDLEADSGFVDTLLHPQDCAYSVPEVFAFVENNGLHFQCWLDNQLYFPEACIRPGSRLWKRIKALPEREQSAVVENLTLAIGRHAFIATNRDPTLFEICFSGTEWPAYCPERSPGIKILDHPEPGKQSRLRRGGFEFQLDPTERMLFDHCDGMRNIGEIAASHGEITRSFFERMWKLGHILIAKRPVPGITDLRNVV